MFYLFYLMSFIYIYICVCVCVWRAIYLFLFFSRQVLFFLGGSWFICFPASLIFYFSASLLSVSLRLCFLLSLLLSKFSASLFSLPLCCTSVPFYFCYSTVSFRQSCVFAALIPAPLRFFASCLYYLVVFQFLLFYFFCLYPK